ncbi:MAG TPA: HDOD domain-containing protein [Candidatus Hydrogenedentes bacterium]|nr:HDOD domain-containing protein [Candidatus Hydrogenedentota bacterium]HOS02532.1 HDOD domain-containing protein [Candidatus Hydrogenedentota bacterium]
MDSETLRRRVAELANLPTLPGVLQKAAALAEDGQTSAADMANLISGDPALSAKTLRLVNSPAYGFPGRISSVAHAVALLGLHAVKGLVLGATTFDSLDAQGQGLWRHSFGCAVISRRLARECGLATAEECFVAGLLHDLGKMTLSCLYPDAYQDAIAAAIHGRLHIAEAEKTAFGTDHARVARWLAEEWRFPARLADPLEHHHAPGNAGEFRNVAAIVHVADILARGMGYGFPGDRVMPPLDHEAFQGLRLSFEQIGRVVHDSETEFNAGSDLFAAEE